MTPSKEASKSVVEHRGFYLQKVGDLWTTRHTGVQGFQPSNASEVYLWQQLLATREALKLARWERHYGPERYAVEYLLKGETEWRRTMDQPIDALPFQERVLWKNPAMAGTRMVAYCDSTRLLRDDELAQLAQKEGE